MSNKSVFIAFLGNINFDSRVSNLYKSFKDKGYSLKVVAFDWLTENFTTQKGEVTIYKLNKGTFSLLFYLKFKLLLIYNLLFHKYDIYFAEDIYTLPFVSLIGKIKNGKIIYDSRELYGYLAGLRNRKIIQNILRILEKIFIKRVDIVICTGDMDAEFLKNTYTISNTLVIKNLPLFIKPSSPIDFYSRLGISKNKKILIYQGVILHGRGIGLIFSILKSLPNYVAIFIGDGEYKKYYEKLAIDLGLKGQVFFTGKIDQKELLNYTAGAHIGMALIENISLSYYYALPNKLFEYILAEIPVIVSNLPQMDAIVKKFEVGISVDPNNENEIIESILKITTNEETYRQLKLNCSNASKILNWEKEVENLFQYI
jgi:glycosyltransferase involved in cell wall biosynthesis